ncbi:MAG TPA: glycoside hydrolase family 130 protein [Bacteroidales bacterium]|nr:glycoside hydrolase family 130 protein [Bacteroidales bacterium]
MKKFLLFIAVIQLIVVPGCNQGIKQPDNIFLVPFTKELDVNPVLEPLTSTRFWDPVRKDSVAWEAKDVFNPAAVVRHDTLFLLYRAEDSIGKYNGTSRIGLASSTDGYHFTRRKTPVLYPSNDDFLKYEWEGGCEDPRVVMDDSGTYYMTYTAYDGDKARLFVATSTNLVDWTKHGSVFRKAGDEYVNMWSKSGSVISREQDGSMVATKVNGVYWMYWGESNIYMATSENLIDWTPVLEKDPSKMYIDTMRHYTKPFRILFSTRKGMFDSELVEPGPPAMITDNGILFIYNSKNSPVFGDKSLSSGTYAAGQILTDLKDPEKVIDRMNKWFITPDQPYEITGQVNNVCFVEGLAFFRDRWLLYYGTADSKIAVAESDKKIKAND